MLERTKARFDVPVAVGFGIGTPEAAAAAADAGADGVIVGSRLVRAAAESPDPAGGGRRAGGRLRRCVEAVARTVRPARHRISRPDDRRALCAPHGLLTTIAGLVVWIVLWAIGVKSFDAFMITIAMILIAATAHVFAPHLPGKRRDDESGTRWNPR